MIITDETILKQPCQIASIFEGTEIIKKLEYELKNAHTKGCGLAAIQIGISKRVAIIRSDISLNLINPEIIKQYDLSIFRQEGCLSYPNIYIATKRYNEMLIRDDLHPDGIILTGTNAVIAAHEVGHLFGETMFGHEIKIPKGPNDTCWCWSGKKYKKCCAGKEIK